MAYHAGMSRFAPLLRALLCLVLLLNGTTYAHAATRMAMGGTAAVEQAHDDAPPCHESMDMAMQMDEEGANPAGHPDGDAGLPDCCKAGSCMSGRRSPPARQGAAPVLPHGYRQPGQVSPPAPS